MERGLFREAEDGTTVWFPWGLSQRGYVLRNDADRRRATRAATLLMGACLGIAGWAAQALDRLLDAPEPAGAAEVLRALAAPGAAFAAAFLGYVLWVWRVVEDLPESSLRVSREDGLREAARVVPPWKLALAGAAIAAMGALVLWLDPHAWWAGGAGVATGVAIVAWAVVIHRVAATPPRDDMTDPIR